VDGAARPVVSRRFDRPSWRLVASLPPDDLPENRRGSHHVHHW
jgi:hypothetical protein